MSNYNEIFQQMKAFIDFGDSDVEHLKALSPLVAKHGPTVSEAFYQKLLAEPETSTQISGIVDRLKQTHHTWMMGMVGGDYGDTYFESRWRIGMAHVRIGLAPYWVEFTMSVVRIGLIAAFGQEISNPVELAAKSVSLVKACDLDLMIINLSYGEERIDRLTSFTGMKRQLLENIIRLDKR